MLNLRPPESESVSVSLIIMIGRRARRRRGPAGQAGGPEWAPARARLTTRRLSQSKNVNHRVKRKAPI